VRSGVWCDFATGEKGGDYVSLVAYIRGCSQGDAALELADKLRVLPTIAVAASGTSASRASSETAKIYNYGDEGPPRFKNELRRHVYKRNDGKPFKIKLKLRNEDMLNCTAYRLDGRRSSPTIIAPYHTSPPASIGSTGNMTKFFGPRAKKTLMSC
jgi:putative DNA primase/helicase